MHRSPEIQVMQKNKYPLLAPWIYFYNTLAITPCTFNKNLSGTSL